jgi:hypothetical protein
VGVRVATSVERIFHICMRYTDAWQQINSEVNFSCYLKLEMDSRPGAKLRCSNLT